MKCDDLIKENYKVYMIDDRGIKLDLENDLLIQKYEKANDVKVINMVSDFLNTHDEKFNNIILQIEKMVKEYSIDYFIYGNGTGGSKDALALMYN
ncbi:hypothetical protein [Clostridium tagluense]|nr:hypothetical protein [Clostridium tagluense]MBW9157810.1 hypothetical protein [Clostridium tagluense]WLC63785.1 hypothetical protein KTC93_12915 [Clostridium tagluense]